MSSFQIFRQADKESAAAEAGEHLNLILVENKKRPVLLMLSAGSALNILEFVGQTALGENLTISMLDERFSQDPAINNFHQLQKHDFYNLAFEAECSFFGTIPRHEDTMESLAARWEKNLRAWRQENPEGLIIATLGMGPDGHTAGIFPYPEDAQKFQLLFEGPVWVIPYNAGTENKFPERVTTTISFLKNIDIGVAYICGPKKKSAFERLLKKQGRFNELPALAWNNINDLRVFTDLQT